MRIILTLTEIEKLVCEKYGLSGVMVEVDTSVPREMSVTERKVQTELNAVMAFIQANKKIEAIKYVRNITGLGLRESKDLVEASNAENLIRAVFSTFIK